MSLQLEQYLDNLETLPPELKKNLTKMRDLDQNATKNLQSIDALAHTYLTGSRTWSAEKRNKQLDEIHKLFGQTKSVSDEKVDLAVQTYEMVDRHIRKLDSDLARFEGEMKQRLLGNLHQTEKKKKKVNERRRKLSDDETPRISKKRKERLGIHDELSPLPDSSQIVEQQQLIKTLSGSGGDVLDMPVDPNEPTYCTCRQVSYGEMIGCDNSDCPIEWFHFGCVGLAAKPKGKWYCQKCRDERKK